MPILPTRSAPAEAPDPRLHKAAQALEALLLKQIVVSSGAFQGGQSAGSAVREGIFADTLADALAQSGGIGLAGQIERSLSRAAGARSSAPSQPPVATARAQVAAAPVPGPTQGAMAASAPLANPSRVTSGFGQRADPFTGRLAEHRGVDLSAPEGSPVLAAAGGVVKRAGPRGGYGNAVEVDHGNGLTTIYAHMSELLVHEGDQVAPGQAIARVGHTGRATGPHLHFEVRIGGRPVDPARALKAYALRADGILERGP